MDVRELSGGLRYAATTGYYLTALQAEIAREGTHPVPRGVQTSFH